MCNYMLHTGDSLQTHTHIEGKNRNMEPGKWKLEESMGCYTCTSHEIDPCRPKLHEQIMSL